MAPKKAIRPRMRIAMSIRLSVVPAMQSHPRDWATHKCKGSTCSEEPFESFICMKSSVAKKAVITKTNSETARDEVESDEPQEANGVWPIKHSSDREDVSHREEEYLLSVYRTAIHSLPQLTEMRLCLLA